MNQIWSKEIQGVKTLYFSRKLRFHSQYAQVYKNLFQLDEKKKLKILEIGCGPGALAEAMHDWYPSAEIVAIDRDSNFIEFAKEHISGVEFLEAEIEHLPFEKESFDVIISNTVSEHIETELFFSGQYELLKQGGICLCISSLKGITHPADCLQMTEQEEEFWTKLEQAENTDDVFSKYGIGKYRLNEQELPLAMEKHGFTKISTGYVVTNLTPDNEGLSESDALEMIEAERLSALEILERIKAANYDFLANHEVERMQEITNQKYEQRIRLYQQGIKQWDCNVGLSMVVKGEKARDIICEDSLEYQIPAVNPLLLQLREEKEKKVSGRLYHELQVRMTYNSNHIEGSTLTEEQTRYIFETNTIGAAEVVPVDDIIETVNHFRAIDYCIEIAEQMLTEEMIKKLHHLLKSGTKAETLSWFRIGDYKGKPNLVGGRETCKPENVEKEMRLLLKRYHQKTSHTMEDIVTFHYEFECIHPFQDGNGRVGRLIALKECLRHNITPFIIEDSKKYFYYRGLQEYKKEPNYLLQTCYDGQDVFQKMMEKLERT